MVYTFFVLPFLKSPFLTEHFLCPFPNVLFPCSCGPLYKCVYCSIGFPFFFLFVAPFTRCALVFQKLRLSLSFSKPASKIPAPCRLLLCSSSPFPLLVQVYKDFMIITLMGFIDFHLANYAQANDDRQKAKKKPQMHILIN